MLQLIISLTLGLSALGAALGAPRVVTLSEVVEKVSKENYAVYSNALRVYQTKEGVQVARMNLLPRLNLWKVAGVGADIAIGAAASGPVGAVGGAIVGVLTLIEDIAPFLVPANWFRLEQAKLLYLVQKEGMRALWANEVMTAKALYVHLLVDRSLFTHVEQSIADLERLLRIIRSREMLGGAMQGASRDIEIRILALQEDKRSLEVLIGEEATQLAFLMALPGDLEVVPAPITMPDFESLEPLSFDDFEFRAVDSAPEIRQFDHFMAATEPVRKEILFSFLGTSNMSRGVGGGVFDSIPTQAGLGFGTSASLRIVSAEAEKLEVQKIGIRETVRRQLRVLINNYNLDLENYTNLKRRADLSTRANEQLYERMRLGQNVEILELVEASRNHIQADTSFFAVKYRFVANEDKLSRLIFHGDYSKPPAEIESLNKAIKGRNSRTSPPTGRKGS